MPSRHLIRTPTGTVISGQNKALDKHLDALAAGVALERANVQAIEAIEIEKIHALKGAGNAALGAIANVAAHRRVYAARDPTAVGCLVHVTDMVSLAIGDRIERLSRRLG
ncbi:MAG: hypothetical protein ACTHM1_12040 [Solirubrobacteraceae bacterium]